MSENERLDPVSETKSVDTEKKSKDKKTNKAKKEKKGNRFVRWLREMRSELKKVQWPTWQQVLKNTGIVILCVLVIGIFIWVFDALAHAIIQALMNLFS